MNDIGYIDERYEDSICCTAITNTNDTDQLTNKLRAIESAINYHKEEQNPKQVQFFKAARDHVYKKLKIKPEEKINPGTQLTLL
jgi:hypothetical protein